MATTIDELVVKIGLDPAGYTQGQKNIAAQNKVLRDDVTATGKELEARGAQGAEFFHKITSAALELGAVLVGAGSLDKYLSTAVPQISALGRATALLGDSTQDLQAFQRWVNQAGGDAANATGDILKLSQTMQGFKSGFAVPGKDFLTGLSFVHGSVNDSSIQLFEKFADYAKGVKGPQARQIGQMLGLSDELIALAIESKGGARAGIDTAAGQPGILNKTQIDDVTKMQGAWRKLRDEIGGSANVLTANMAPTVTHILNLFLGAEKATSQLDRNLVQIAEDAGPLAADLGNLWNTIKGMFDPNDVNNFFAAFDHQLRALDALVRIVVDSLKIAQSLIRGDWSGVTAAAKDEGQAWKDYALEQAATVGLGPNAGAGANTDNGGFFGWAHRHGYFRAAGESSAPASFESAGAGPAGSSAVQAAERDLYGTFTSGGLNDNAAMGAIAQLRAESGLNPHNINPHSAGESHATGIGQWLKSRADAFRAWSGHSLLQSNVDEEGRFAMYEAAQMPGFIDRLNAAPDAQAALEIWTKFFGLGGMHGKGDVASKEQAAFAYDVRQGAKYLPSVRSAVHGGGDVHIGSIHVNAPHATDAHHVAKHIKKALASELATQSNGALN